MGTRGTLRVYVNCELKIRQYNQWDSYPTGQFKEICEAMSNEHVRKEFVDRLLNVRFATEQEWKNVCDGKSSGYDSITQSAESVDRWLLNLCDRDIGSKIIYLVAGQPTQLRLIPDWWIVVKDSPWWPASSEDLEGQEGNYRIDIECDVTDSSFYPSADNIRFKLSGDWHGIKREFDWNHIPTDEEITQWESSEED